MRAAFDFGRLRRSAEGARDLAGDPAREGRHAGSAGAAAAAEYISQQLKELGCDVQMQEFGGRRKNVIGRVGTADRYIVLGAHYDGQGPGMPSASDNAAGVAVVLEFVRELKTRIASGVACRSCFRR